MSGKSRGGGQVRPRSYVDCKEQLNAEMDAASPGLFPDAEQDADVPACVMREGPLLHAQTLVLGALGLLPEGPTREGGRGQPHRACVCGCPGLRGQGARPLQPRSLQL